MLRDAGVRTKLLAVLAIPTLLLVVVTSLLVGGQVTAARRAGQVNALTDVAIQVNRVVHSLQEERSATLGYLQDPTAGAAARMKGQRQFTNQQLRTLRQLVADSPVAQMSHAVQAAVARSASGHDELAGARRSVDAGRFFTTETDVFYSKVIRTDLDLPGVVASSGTSALAQRLQAYEAVSTAIEYASHERDIVETALLRGTLTEADFGQAAAMVSEQRTALADFQRNADAATYARLDNALAAAENYEIDQVRRDLPDLLKGREPAVGRSVQWVGSANSRIGPMTDTESGVVADIATGASELQSSQEQRALLLVVAAVLGLGLALVLAVGLARRITRPLRRLTVAAGEIGAELPRMVERMQTPGDGPGVVVEPIPVESADEIGRLAEAFNTVNDVTVQVAKEQAALRSSIAEMFVNVARRNQVLLGRQLSQLDSMEAREEDADVLDSLFKLDHLATRMRRNAESLLVLAGIDSTRRLRRPLPLSDVIRTAVGEIEAFDRIDLSMSEDPDVSGRHALTVSHLLAEVLENATHFSNPETRVVVSATVTGHSVDLTVTDYGLGMSEDEVVEANAKIAHPPVAEIAVSQRLGLFVVGRLAARLGASVALRRGRAAGLVVAVTLPLSVFEGLTVAEPDAEEAPAPVFEAAGDETTSRIVQAPADDALEVVTAPEPTRAPQPEPVAASPAPALLSAASVPALTAGDALVPEVSATETAPLPSRRSTAAPSRTPAAEAERATLAAVESPTDTRTAPVTAAGEHVTAVEAVPAVEAGERQPEGPGRRGLFARWSRTPAEDADEVAAVVEVAESTDDEAVAAVDPVVELLAVETPADDLSVELEVEMVTVADDSVSDDVLLEADDVPESTALEDDVVEDTAQVEPDGTLDVHEEHDDLPVDDVAPAASRRRGLFARWSRQPASDAAPELPVEDAVEALPVEVVEDSAGADVEDALDEDDSVAVVDDTAGPDAEAVEVPLPEVEPEPWPVAEVEPKREPEPAPPPVVYAKAVDVLPSRSVRSGGVFGRHRKPGPAPVESPVAAAPAAVLPQPPVEPMREPVAAEPTVLIEPTQAAPAEVEPVPAPQDLIDDLVDPVAQAPATQVPAVESPVVDGPPAQAPAAAVPLATRRPASAGPDVAGSLPSRIPSSAVEPVGLAPSADLDRMAAQAQLHQSALSELRGLYEPSFAAPAPAPVPTESAGLTRRTPKAAVDAGVAGSGTVPPPARTRTAAEVRGMLSGFRAGVERGRGSDATDAHADASADSDTTPPR
jgi:HAMP domain-containing protein